MLYLDSGVFVYASLSRKSTGRRARELLRRVRDGYEAAGSCALTFDEVVWVVKKHRSREDGLAAGRSFLELRNLSILPVGQDSLFTAVSLMEKYSLNPRDAIHASAAISNRCPSIVSGDADFDRIKEISRKPI